VYMYRFRSREHRFREAWNRELGKRGRLAKSDLRPRGPDRRSRQFIEAIYDSLSAVRFFEMASGLKICLHSLPRFLAALSEKLVDRAGPFKTESRPKSIDFVEVCT
jgi:AcrR family transcriptional regulator